MKKLFASILMAVSMILFVGCGQNEDTSTSDTSTDTSVEGIEPTSEGPTELPSVEGPTEASPQE